MPSSSHVHKSMLLRGVKLSTPALNRDDIEATKGRAATAGRNPGGQQRGGYGGRGRGGYGGNQNSNNGPGYSRPQQYPREGQGGHNGYSQYPQPPQGWQPPPPGVGGFARGPPPPPPVGYNQYPAQQSHGHGQYGAQYPAPLHHPQQQQPRDNRGNKGGPPRGGYRY